MTIIKVSTGYKIETFCYESVIHKNEIRNQVLKCLKVCCNDWKSISEMSRFLKKIKDNELEKYIHSGDIIITVIQNTEEIYYIYSGILNYRNTL